MKNNGTQLRKMIQSHKTPAKILAITSGKGGVGKTNISANLAICLAATGKRVLLFDADMSLANLDIVMGIDSRYNLSHLINGSRSIEDIIHQGPEGLEVICGGSGIEDMANLTAFQRQRILSELNKLSRDTDAIVIDTAAGICKSVVNFCLLSDHVLVVTTPQPTAMTDAYAMIKVLVGNRYAGRISLIVNMADSPAQGRKIYQQVANVANRFLNTHIYNAGVLLKDDRLTEAVKQRKPVVLAYPKSKISSSLLALAAKLGNGSLAATNEDGFFKRVVDWFF